jgi:hypothetical protein
MDIEAEVRDLTARRDGGSTHGGTFRGHRYQL